MPGSFFREIIDMFAMRKSDKQVRDKEARIPRVSPSQDSEVTGEENARPKRPRAGTREWPRANEALDIRSGTRVAVGVIF